MILRARTISYLVHEQLTCAAEVGRVHSVFQRTVNVLCHVPCDVFEGRPGGGMCEGDRGGSAAGTCHAASGPGMLVSIHTSDVAMHPFAVRLEAGAERYGLQAFPGIYAGQVATLTPEELSLGDRIRVRLKGAEVYDHRPGEAVWGESVGEGAICGRCPASWTGVLLESMGRVEITSPFLQNGGCRGSIEAALIARCRAIMNDLRLAWRGGDPKDIAGVMAEAVGLGRGLTPSGDDFLVGFLGAAAYFTYGSDMRDLAFAREVAASLHIGKRRTTLPSLFMLRGALSGFLPEPLKVLLRAVGAGDPERVRKSVLQLMLLGATSGQDMLAGVICYFEAGVGAGERT